MLSNLSPLLQYSHIYQYITIICIPMQLSATGTTNHQALHITFSITVKQHAAQSTTADTYDKHKTHATGKRHITTHTEAHIETDVSSLLSSTAAQCHKTVSTYQCNASHTQIHRQNQTAEPVQQRLAKQNVAKRHLTEHSDTQQLHRDTHAHRTHSPTNTHMQTHNAQQTLSATVNCFPLSCVTMDSWHASQHRPHTFNNAHTQ